MASRFYLPSSGAAAVSPAVSPSWDVAASLSQFNAVRTRISSATAGAVRYKGAVNRLNQNVVALQYITEPLAAQTTSGTVKGQMRAGESNAALNARAQVIVRVVSNDGATVRGTLYAGDTTTVGATTNPAFELGATTNRKIPFEGAVTLTDITIQAQDRIVIEIGYRVFTSSTIDYYAAFYSSDNNATDLPEDDTTTSPFNSWIEFSQDIATYVAGASHPLTATVTGTATVAVPRIVLSHPLSGAIAGLSAAGVPGIVLTPDLAASSAGVSTATGTRLTLTHPLAAIATGSSAASVTSLKVSPALAASVVAASTAGAPRITLDHPLAGVLFGTSVATVTRIGLSHPLAIAIAGTSASAAERLSLGHPLQGAISATSVGGASRIVLRHPLDVAVFGGSLVLASLAPIPRATFLAPARPFVAIASRRPATFDASARPYNPGETP